VLGVISGRVGLSAIPAYLLAGLLLGPNEPRVTTVIEPSEVTTFIAELGLVFLLFFLGLEFSLDRVTRTTRHLVAGGSIDLVVNAGIGIAVGIAAFGLSFAALIMAGAIYVSSSAVTVKGLIDFRRLADDETDLVLAILVVEDIVIAAFLGFSAAGGGGVNPTLVALAKAIAFVGVALLLARYLGRRIGDLLERLDAEFLLIFVVALIIGMGAAAKALELSEAIGALMAGILLADTTIREEIEARLLGLRDLFAALFFFAFGLSIDVSAIDDVGVILALAVAATVAGKLLAGYIAGRLATFTKRQSLNAGAALVAHGEFTIILAQIASGNSGIPQQTRDDIVAFAGLYVLATATLGVVLMKQSKRIGRVVFPTRAVVAKE
jgi:CPA2 family monovalent cation:H+ antiporter-2